MKKCLLALLSLGLSVSLHAQWNSLGSGVNTSSRKVYSLSVPGDGSLWGSVVHATFASGSPTVIHSTDNGTTWAVDALPGAGADENALAVFARNADSAWVVTGNRPNFDQSKIYATTNGGTSWTEQAGPFNAAGHGLIGIHFFDGLTGIAYGSPSNVDSLRIYRTTDGGANWTRLSPSLLPPLQAGEGVVYASGNGACTAVGDDIWFATKAGRVWHSSDRGENWTAASTGLNRLSSVAFRDAQHGIAVSDFGGGVRTSNGGLSWQPITLLPAPSPVSVMYVPGTVGGYVIHDGIYNLSAFAFTADEGSTWVEENVAPSMDCMVFLSTTEGYGGANIVSGSVGGVYEWTGNLATVASLDSRSFAEAGWTAGPNPTHDVLTLSWPDPAAGWPEVQILDLTGRPLPMPVPQRTGPQ
ncbi:MAG: hypothetical protein D6722_00735, partial [Bacteroidetes bacterium]